MKLARKITLLLLITLLIVIVGYFFNVNNDVIDLDFVLLQDSFFLFCS